MVRGPGHAGGAVIRVLLADDEDDVRAAVADLLGLEPDIDVVAQAADGRSAIELAGAHRPEVAVVDLEMPRTDGIGVAAALSAMTPPCRVVILTGRGRPVHPTSALAAGAGAFLVKGASGAALADVIRLVAQGRRYVDPTLAAETLSVARSPLSARERDVLALAGAGLDAARTARRLHLAPGTVRNLRRSACRRLGASSVAEAVTIARDASWI